VKTAEDYADDFVAALPKEMNKSRSSMNWQVGFILGEVMVQIVAETNAKFEAWAKQAMTSGSITAEQFDDINRRST
jgi:hypothetical protein